MVFSSYPTGPPVSCYAFFFFLFLLTQPFFLYSFFFFHLTLQVHQFLVTSLLFVDSTLKKKKKKIFTLPYRSTSFLLHHSYLLTCMSFLVFIFLFFMILFTTPYLSTGCLLRHSFLLMHGGFFFPPPPTPPPTPLLQPCLFNTSFFYVTCFCGFAMTWMSYYRWKNSFIGFLFFFFFSKSTSCCTHLLVYFEDFLLQCKLWRCTMIVICMWLQMKRFEVYALVCLFTIFYVFVCKYYKYQFSSWSVVSSYIVKN